MKTLKKTLVVEAALAGLLLAVAAPALADQNMKAAGKEKAGKAKAGKKGKKAPAGDEKVNCLGVNACKGQSACGVEGGHGCKGQNACKGKGWISLGKKECMDKKGTVQKDGAQHGHSH